MKKHPISIFQAASLLIPVAIASGCTSSNKKTLVTPEPNKDGNYNIVFITTDQEAYMENYPEGSDYAARERLRQIGTTFEKHYACSNVSTSSRSVIYTGRHVTETKMLDNTNFLFQANLDPDLKTVGDMLREAGYYTALKGKWHISEGDTTLEHYGFADWTEGDMYGATLEGFHEDNFIANKACEWLETKGKTLNNNGQSFFLAVNFINPHDIMYYYDGDKKTATPTCTAPDHPTYKKEYPTTPLPQSWNEPITKEGRPQSHDDYYVCGNITTGDAPTSEEGWRKFRDYYFNCIQDCDNQMNILLNYLEEKGLMKNTIIIYTADHGEMMGAHSLKGKGGNIYENNIHVPLVIYHPEVEGGKTYSHVTSHLDLAPTFVDIATDSESEMENIKAGIKGHSLLPAVSDNDIDVRNGKGALFVFDMISMIDKDLIIEGDLDKGISIKADMSKRGYLRGIITSNYKFARYFSPINFNTPTNIEELYNNNDVEMYATESDETENLAYPQGNNEVLVMQYNSKLNDLILHEVGIDDGRETQSYKGGLMQYAK